MDLTALCVFAGIYALAVISPGPGVAAVLARALAMGARRTWPFILGIVLGDLAWFFLVAAGLSVIAQTFGVVFTIIKYAGAAYLVFLAWKLWHAPAAAPSDVPQARGEGIRLTLAGLALTLGNPKTIAFFLAVLPQILPLDRVTPLAFVELSAMMAVVLGTIMLGYALLAERARRFIGSSRAMRIVNRLTGGLMASAAVAVATR